MIDVVYIIWHLISENVPINVMHIFIAMLLGMFIGLEREWSDKPVGIRTFSLLSVIGSLTVIINVEYFTILGGFLVFIISILLGLRGVTDLYSNKQNILEKIKIDYYDEIIILNINSSKSTKYDRLEKNIDIDDFSKRINKLKKENIISLEDSKVVLTNYGDIIKERLVDKHHRGMSLTTSVSLFVAYIIGVAVAFDFYLEAVTVTILSSFILLLKNELHKFAGTLSKKELSSSISFAILAFIIFPILPNQSLGPFDSVNPVTVWTLIVAISAIGLVNYILVLKYREKGIMIGSFLGGLVNSTSVVADISNRTNIPKKSSIGCISLANSAMSIRNILLLFIFLPLQIELIIIGLPLISLTLTGIFIAYYFGDWDKEINIENINSPFSMKNALSFGGLFLVILVLTSSLEFYFGSDGFITATALAGLISSGTATATAIALYLNGQISLMIAIFGVLIGTISSIMVKVVYVYYNNRELSYDILKYSLVMILFGLVSLTIPFLILRINIIGF